MIIHHTKQTNNVNFRELLKHFCIILWVNICNFVGFRSENMENELMVCSIESTLQQAQNNVNYQKLLIISALFLEWIQ